MTVTTVLDSIQERGLDAALEYTWQYDRVRLNAQQVLWNPLNEPPATVDLKTADAVEFAIAQIQDFHEKTRPQGVTTTPQPGINLEERFMPLSRVGIYIPNGAFPLVSTLLMTAIPAQVAGVGEIIAAVSPRRNIRESALWTYLFQRLEISQVLLLGGAQAIGTLAYGFDGFAPVDLVAGPGNRWVAEAKQEVFRRGLVGIDVSAGPSEVLIIANQLEFEDFVLADLLAQAEHDQEARAEFLTQNSLMAIQVKKRLKSAQKKGMGAITVTVVDSAEEIVQIANQRAPEHLGLMGDDVEPLANRIWAAGALFIGPWAGQALGDYIAGPSHVLPTGGTARFQSGLSTRTFLKRISVIKASPIGSPKAYEHAAVLAGLEGLSNHEYSLRLRLSKWAAKEMLPHGTDR